MTEEYVKRKEQDKTPEEELSEVELGNLTEKEFRIVIIKMIKELWTEDEDGKEGVV